MDEKLRHIQVVSTGGDYMGLYTTDPSINKTLNRWLKLNDPPHKEVIAIVISNENQYKGARFSNTVIEGAKKIGV